MDIKEAIAAVESHPDYRILKKFKPVACYAEPGTKKTRLMMVIDTETTGLDATKDKIIEIGYVLARIDVSTGDICDVVARYSGLEYPGFPISEEITKLTGIKNEDLAGKKFDDDLIQDAISKADLVVAHNAAFDRGFLEARYPAFEGKWWACSMRECPWSEMQTGSTKLEYLAYLCGFFYEAHRALVDSEVLLHVLTAKAHDGRSISSHLLERARKPSYRVWATNSPFGRKDDLKKAGYRWADGSDPALPHKAWYKDGVLDLDGEMEFLNGIYASPGEVLVESMSGRERYSGRRGTLSHSAVGNQRTENGIQ